jgi:3-dehydroquinate synthetase
VTDSPDPRRWSATPEPSDRIDPMQAAGPAPRPGGTPLQVTASGGAYPVWIASDALAFLGRYARAALPAAKVVTIVSDENVAPRYAAAARAALLESGLAVTQDVVIGAGEAGKSFATLETILTRLATLRLPRDGFVVALGGGTVCDVAGLAAALWLRGVAWIAVPTTLLAQIDAAIGGKTAIDLPAGKNLAGAFHPPAAVVADPRTLATLPEHEWRSGRGELLKYGVLGGDALLARIVASGRDAEVFRAPHGIALIRDCVAIKVDLVTRDEFDHGPRRALNLGHTIGHAIETALDHRGPSHGEAVAVGLLAEAGLAIRLGLAAPELHAELVLATERLALPRWIRDAPPGTRERALGCLHGDKKRTAQTAIFALPRAIGDVAIVAVDDPEAIAAAVGSAFAPAL